MSAVVAGMGRTAGEEHQMHGIPVGIARDAARRRFASSFRCIVLLASLALAVSCQASAPAKPAGAGGPAGASAAPTAPAASAPAPPLRQLKVANAATTPTNLPVWLAADDGYFRRHGLDVEVLSLRSGPTLQAALIAREVDIAVGGYSAAILAKAGGADVVMLGTLFNRPVASLVVHPGIERPEDLRGKRLGVQSVGGSVWARGMMALEKYGLDPDRDEIAVLTIGDQPTLGLALLAGSIDAAPIGPTIYVPLLQQGFAAWDLAALAVREITQVFVVTTAFRDEEQDTLEQFLRAMAEAVAYLKGIPNDPARRQHALEIAGRYLSVPPEKVAPEVDVLVPLIPEDLRLEPEAMQQMYAFSLRDNPDIARVGPDSIVDQRLLQRLEQEGLFRQLYGRSQ
jgi:NitT/TauT family transport system substrate-binding protein